MIRLPPQPGMRGIYQRVRRRVLARAGHECGKRLQLLAQTILMAALAGGVPVIPSQAERPSVSPPGDEIKAINVGGHTLYLPDGYLSSFMGYAGHVQIHVLLPCLEPETPENRQEFHVTGWGRILIAQLDSWDDHYLEGRRLLEEHIRLSRFYEKYDTKTTEQSIGPIRVQDTAFEQYKDFLLSLDLFTLPGTHPLFLVYCNMISRFVPAPGCNVQERIWGNMRLLYWYGRSHVAGDIPNTIAIDRRLRLLLDSFTRPSTSNKLDREACK